MSDLDRVANELKAEGYDSFRFSSPQGEAVSIKYKIPTGKHKGEEVSLGFSFQEVNYPEYPPHWIFISPPYSDGKSDHGTFIRPDSQGIDREWRALSRPPSDFWDNLSTKHMSQYLQIHISRFCHSLQ